MFIGIVVVVNQDQLRSCGVFNCPVVFFLCYSQRYETLLKDLEKKSEEQREVLISLQQEFKKAQGLSAGKA